MTIDNSFTLLYDNNGGYITNHYISINYMVKLILIHIIFISKERILISMKKYIVTNSTDEKRFSNISLKKPMMLCLLGLILMIPFSLTGCKDKDKTNDLETNVEDSAVLDEEEPEDEIQDILEADRPEEDEEDSVDAIFQDDDVTNEEDVSVEEEEQHPFTFEDLYHNVYSGTIGTESVVMDLYPKKEDKVVDISLISKNHTENTVYEANYPDDYTIVYQGDDFTLYLSEFEDGVLSGTYDDNSGNVLEVSLNLSHVNYETDPNKYYTIGSNEEVEAFASKIQKLIGKEDIEGLSKLVAYPLTLNMSEGITVNNANELIALGTEKVITTELKTSIMNSYPRFMFCNAEGVMLGNVEYNIWFSLLTDGTIKIIAINN